MDGSGNVYVTGGSTSSDLRVEYATLKYDTTGNRLWIARYSGTGNGWGNYARSLAVDGSGNIYVTGDSVGSDPEGDYATVKYDANGNEQWVARYDGPGNNLDVAESLAVDGSGNVYITGWSTGNGTGFDYATIKYLATPTVNEPPHLGAIIAPVDPVRVNTEITGFQAAFTDPDPHDTHTALWE